MREGDVGAGGAWPADAALGLTVHKPVCGQGWPAAWVTELHQSRSLFLAEGCSWVGSAKSRKNYTQILCSFQANDGNWPTLKQNSSSSVKPTQISSVDWKDSNVEGPVKQGAVSSQPVPLSTLGATEKLVGRLSLSQNTDRVLTVSLFSLYLHLRAVRWEVSRGKLILLVSKLWPSLKKTVVPQH